MFLLIVNFSQCNKRFLFSETLTYSFEVMENCADTREVVINGLILWKALLLSTVSLHDTQSIEFLYLLVIQFLYLIYKYFMFYI